MGTMLTSFLIMAAALTSDADIISAQIAVEVQKPIVAAKPLRKDCPICKGTGRVKAGDGRTTVTRDCTDCIPPANSGDAGPKVGDAMPSPFATPKVRKIVKVSVPNCPPCNSWNANERPKLTDVNIEDHNYDGTIPVAAFPTFVLYEDDVEITRFQGYTTAEHLRLWYDSAQFPKQSPTSSNNDWVYSTVPQKSGSKPRFRLLPSRRR